MPYNPQKLVEDAAQAADLARNLKIESPKFFSDHLTGRRVKGGALAKTGVLSTDADPASARAGARRLAVGEPDAYRRTISNQNVVTRTIPIALTPSAYWYGIADRVPMVDPNHAIQLAKVAHAGVERKAYLRLDPQTVTLQTTSVSKGVTRRELRIAWRAVVYLNDTGTRADAELYDLKFSGRSASLGQNVLQSTSASIQHANLAFVTYVADVTGLLESLLDMFERAGWDVDRALADQEYRDFHTYDALTEAARHWQTDIDQEVASVIETCARALKGVGGNAVSKVLVETVHRLEAYPVPLSLYQPIYDKLMSTLPTDIAQIVIKSNLNLMLSDTMAGLEKVKDELVTCPVKPGVTSDPFFSTAQRQAIETHEPLAMIQSVAGSGKALPLDEPVLTPEGWKPMGDIEIGDAVIGDDGLVYHVTGVYDQGEKLGWQLTFRDRSTIRACDDHLWEVEYWPTGRHSVISTKDWVEKARPHEFALPIVKPVQFPHRDLPIDPYLLGSLLADGGLNHNTIQYTKNEVSVIEAVREAAARDGYDMIETTSRTSTARRFRFADPLHTKHHPYNRLNRRLKDLGLRVTSHFKFIPDIYKFADIDQRRELLAGLFDGDGRVRNHRGYAMYSSASYQLAHDVLELAWSLGLIARIYEHKHPRGNYWSVQLLDSYNPFKASEWRDVCTGTVKRMHRSLVKFERIEPVPMRCITVDSPNHLYVAKDYIVTHNTTVIKGRIQYLTDSGVDPNDILALSFTNAAADQLEAKCPGVKSMTIAKMINAIYSENFDHEISEVPTVANAIRIRHRGRVTPTDLTLIELLKDVEKASERDAYTRLNNFVERHYDEVVRTLDEIGQTTLSLQIVMCYQHIGDYKEPESVRARFLIVDEVQDNSIFEFIYTLKYVQKNRLCMFQVGRPIAHPKSF